MKTARLLLFTLALFGAGLANAQNSTRHPLEKYGYKIPVLTLTNGKYYEYFDDDTLVQIGTVMFNTNTNKVVAFVKYDTLFTETGYAPDISSHFISIDPHADRYVSMSPYAYAACNPIRYNDPDGQDAIDIVLGFVDGTVSIFSFGLLGNGNNPMVRSQSDYQNGKSIGSSFSTAISLLQGLSGGGTSAPEVATGGTSLVIKAPAVSTIAPNAVVNTEGSKEKQGSGEGRGKNDLKPDQKATGDHSTFKTDQNGKITNTATYKSNDKNPNKFDEVKRVDKTGSPHFDKKTGKEIPTPHVHEGNNTRPANPNEIPK